VIEPSAQSRVDRRVEGLISYRRGEREFGRERFVSQTRGDGARALYAHCEMDEGPLCREVALELDAAMRPATALVRLAKGSVDFGSGFFAFGPDFADLTRVGADRTVSHARLALSRPVPFFGAHPIVNDGLWAACRPPGEGRAAVPGALATSFDADGGSGIEMLPFEFTVERIGPAALETPAGRFETLHSAVTLPGVSEPFHLWTIGQDCLVVREIWSARPEEVYELVKLSGDVA